MARAYGLLSIVSISPIIIHVFRRKGELVQLAQQVMGQRATVCPWGPNKQRSFTGRWRRQWLHWLAMPLLVGRAQGLTLSSVCPRQGSSSSSG